MDYRTLGHETADRLTGAERREVQVRYRGLGEILAGWLEALLPRPRPEPVPVKVPVDKGDRAGRR